MGIPEGVNKLPRRQIANLRQHHREQGVGGDVERHAEEHIRAPLVQLARQPPLRRVKLKQRMARRQRHLIQLGDIPRADDMAAGVRLAADLLDEAAELVDAFPARPGPRAPLAAIDRPEFAFGIRPFVPNFHPVLVEPRDVGVPPQEPQQLHDDGAQMQFLGGEHGKAAREIEAHLVAEDAAGAGAGAVGLLHPLFQDALEQCEVLLHLLACR